jgi:hypothetical protein
MIVPIILQMLKYCVTSFKSDIRPFLRTSYSNTILFSIVAYMVQFVRLVFHLKFRVQSSAKLPSDQLRWPVFLSFISLLVPAN